MTGNGLASTGRGGAGNIGSNPPSSMDPTTTPTIKSDIYTTGRGGSGNMAKNSADHPEIARAAQDVAGSADDHHHGYDGPVTGGRGGAGNVLYPSQSEAQKAKERRQSETKDLKERGKALLEKIGVKSSTS